MRKPDLKVSVSIIYVAAMFMSIMDSTIINVALPSIGRQLNVATTSIDAVAVGYLVSLAVVIPASGWLGDWLGTKRIFLAALALFSLASALCGIAPSFPMLVLFRILQGAAGGAMTPVGAAILYRTFPPAERVQVSRILIIPTVVAPAIGPVQLSAHNGSVPNLTAYHAAFLAAAALELIAAAFALTVHDRDAAATMRRTAELAEREHVPQVVAD